MLVLRFNWLYQNFIKKIERDRILRKRKMKIMMCLDCDTSHRDLVMLISRPNNLLNPSTNEYLVLNYAIATSKWHRFTLIYEASLVWPKHAKTQAKETWSTQCTRTLTRMHVNIRTHIQTRLHMIQWCGVPRLVHFCSWSSACSSVIERWSCDWTVAGLKYR